MHTVDDAAADGGDAAGTGATAPDRAGDGADADPPPTAMAVAPGSPTEGAAARAAAEGAAAVAAAEAAAVDGRHRRSQRSRAAIAQAMLDLLRSGETPSSAQIAERAGVTQRTLFNQYGDMESLTRTVVELQAERVVGLLPDAGEGTGPERLTRFTTQLAALLEDTMHVRWVVVTAPTPSDELLSGVRAVQAIVRERVAAGFADELAALGPERATVTLDAIDGIVDPAGWRLRRVHHGRTEDEARAELARTLGALLDIDV